MRSKQGHQFKAKGALQEELSVFGGGGDGN